MAGTKLLTQLWFVASLLAAVPIAFRLCAIERHPLPVSLLQRLPSSIEPIAVHAAVHNLQLRSGSKGGKDVLDRVENALRAEVQRLRGMQSYAPAAQLRMSVTFVTQQMAGEAGSKGGRYGDESDTRMKRMGELQSSISAMAADMADVVPTHLVFQVQEVDLSKMRGPALSQTNVHIVRLPQLQKQIRASRSTVQIGGKEMQLFVVCPPEGEIWDVEPQNGERVDYANIGDKTITAGYWSPSEGLYLIANQGQSDSTRKITGFLAKNLLQIYGIGVQAHSQFANDVEFSDTKNWNTLVQQVAYSVDMYSSAFDALQATSVLVDATPHMIVTKDIAERFTQSVELLLTASEPSQPFHDVFEAIREAFQIAQSIHYDPSMLPTMYFPLDQLFAVYAPLWLPLMAPLIFGTITQVKKYRKATRSKIIEHQ